MSAEEWAHEQGIDVNDLELFMLICEAYEAGQEDAEEERERHA